MINKDSKIFLAGDRSWTAVELKNILIQNGFNNIVGCNTDNLDLRDNSEVEDFFSLHNPEFVILTAAKIEKNIEELQTKAFELLNDNLIIAINMINSSLKYGVKKFVYFSSDITLPYYSDGREVDEEDLLSAPFKENKQAYSLAKIIGTYLCRYSNRKFSSPRFISLLPCYIYGNFGKGLLFSIYKEIKHAKDNNLSKVDFWGTGDLKYKFIHSRDLAEAVFFVLFNQMRYDCYIVAPEKQIFKYELVSMIAKQVGYEGEVFFDEEKKLSSGVNASPKRIMSEGWQSKITLEKGIVDMISWHGGI